MSELERLKYQLRKLESEKKNCSSQKEKYERQRYKAKERKQDIWTIRFNLENSFDNNCSEINRVAGWMETDVRSGLKGISNAASIESTIDADKELKSDVDGKLSRAIEELNAEYNELERYYNSKKEEIRQIDNRKWNLSLEIANVKAKIQKEERKEAAEKFKNMMGL